MNIALVPLHVSLEVYIIKPATQLFNHKTIAGYGVSAIALYEVKMAACVRIRLLLQHKNNERKDAQFFFSITIWSSSSTIFN